MEDAGKIFRASVTVKGREVPHTACRECGGAVTIYVPTQDMADRLCHTLDSALSDHENRVWVTTTLANTRAFFYFFSAITVIAFILSRFLEYNPMYGITLSSICLGIVYATFGVASMVHRRWWFNRMTLRKAIDDLTAVRGLE